MLKSEFVSNFRIVENELLILFLLALIGSIFVPFTFLWVPMIGIAYVAVMCALLYQGLDKLLNKSVFDTSSKYFGGFHKKTHILVLSKIIVGTIVLLEIYLLPIGVILWAVSFHAIDWPNIIQIISEFCSRKYEINYIIIVEIINVVIGSMLINTLFLFINSITAGNWRIKQTQRIPKIVTALGFIICILLYILCITWRIILKMKYSLLSCVLHLVLNLLMLFILIVFVKKSIHRVYENV